MKEQKCLSKLSFSRQSTGPCSSWKPLFRSTNQTSNSVSCQINQLILSGFELSNEKYTAHRLSWLQKLMSHHFKGEHTCRHGKQSTQPSAPAQNLPSSIPVTESSWLDTLICATWKSKQISVKGSKLSRGRKAALHMYNYSISSQWQQVIHAQPRDTHQHFHFCWHGILCLRIFFHQMTQNRPGLLQGRMRMDHDLSLYLVWLREKGFNMDCSSTSVSNEIKMGVFLSCRQDKV